MSSVLVFGNDWFLFSDLGGRGSLGGSVLLISRDFWFGAILGAGLGVWLCLLGL